MYWKIASCLMIIVFFAWVRVELSMKSQRDKEIEESFWERERESNNVRRKNIDNLDYIKMPENLPVDILPDNEKIKEIREVLGRLEGERILNLTGLTNTDLKLEYGTANLTVLSQYDQNYITLSTYMQKWADILWEEGYEKEAISIMEYLIQTGTDIRRTYKNLGQYYLNTFNKEAYNGLLARAETLKSMNGPVIIRELKELV